MSQKICAACKHLLLLDKGREFEKILDTEYLHFKCKIFNWEVKENYLMLDISNPLKKYKEKICEFWEPWDKDK
ncbi:MAG: hypothetical protein HYU63_03170 [Armatimonadetes bacterium]|nr:hypothetical protein [Armatimonadota bacterium]